ncbi:MAG: fumarylacetoacetate hydrolase, partial [Actinomycetota bacterium]|nr:fumarylacetoacetate hydrolase [Actinomycetota bacterium]
MRIANSAGRAVIVIGERVVDIATASEGRFGPD